MSEQLIPFLVASVGLTLSPGPDILYVFTLSITENKTKAIVFASGLVSGLIVHTALVAFGVAAIIKQEEWIFQMIKYFGVAYLLYLAIQAYRSDAQFSGYERQENKKSYLSAYKKGILMNILNPKVSLFFLAFLPGFIWDQNANISIQLMMLGLLFMLQAWIIFFGVSQLGSIINLKKIAAYSQTAQWIQIILLLGIALYLLIG